MTKERQGLGHRARFPAVCFRCPGYAAISTGLMRLYRFSRSSFHNSRVCCIRNQISGPLPSSLPNRIAMSGVIGRRSCNNSDIVRRETPRRLANSSCVSPRVGRTSSRRISPGWVGVSCRAAFPSVIVLQVHAKHMAIFKPKGDSPIVGHFHTPLSVAVTP